ncbi:hypothetical protein Tco_0854198 [Tanacetum coccineum]
MDLFIKNALWDYWKRGEDEIALTNGKVSDLEEEYPYEDGEIAKIIRFETNIFNYEMPLRKAFNEFNYLFQINPDLLTKDIFGFKNYEQYKDDWIYEWNKDVPWNGHSEWPTCSWKDDGYCNGGNLPGTFRVGNTLHYKDLEWYEALEDVKLKDEALKIKLLWKQYEEDKSELLENPCLDPPVCKIGRFEVIKYSFGAAENYIANKEREHNDCPRIEEDACHAYQEIFVSWTWDGS